MKPQTCEHFSWKKKLTLLISLILIITPAFGTVSDSLTARAIKKRLQPISKVAISGKVEVEEPEVMFEPGEEVYQKFCKACHSTGAAGAPKFRTNKWESRVARGWETLMDHTLNGYKAMPKKGNCSECTPDQLKETIEFMLPK